MSLFWRSLNTNGFKPMDNKIDTQNTSMNLLSPWQTCYYLSSTIVKTGNSNAITSRRFLQILFSILHGSQSFKMQQIISNRSALLNAVKIGECEWVYRTAILVDRVLYPVVVFNGRVFISKQVFVYLASNLHVWANTLIIIHNYSVAISYAVYRTKLTTH